MARFVVALIGILAVIGGQAAAAPPEPTPNSVVNSSPANGSSQSVSPDAIIIGFAEELGAGNTISVDCDAEPITLPAAEVIDDTTLQVELETPLPAGTCTARYVVFDTDDIESLRGGISFVAENDSAAPDGTDVADATTPDAEVVDFSVAGRGNAPVWLTRFFSTMAIAVLFGSLLMIPFAWPEGVEYLVTIRFIRATWIVAVIATFLFMCFGAAAVTPDGGGGPFSPGTWGDLFSAGWAGRAVPFRLLFVIASGWVAFRPDRAIDPVTQLGALGLPALATVTIGLSRTIGDTALIYTMLNIVHAVAMAVWIGGVLLLARVVLAGPGDDDLVHAVRGFGRVSTPAIIATILTGLVQMVLLDGGELLSSGHGRLLVFKALIVAAMIFVALSARQFVAQRLNRAHQMTVPLANRLRRAFGAEAAFGVVTLALSAWLLGWLPPNIDAVPAIDYAVTQDHRDAADLMDVRVRLTDNDNVGLTGLEVRLSEPTEGITGLTVVMTAPPNTAIG